ncbi:PP0621 family protein [Sulfuricurvum sp.]|uniref:PP0621 family protein n=1 Tax=Sulfuricurvum sp. TaxID=2025608 RepID=UPI003BB70026
MLKLLLLIGVLVGVYYVFFKKKAIMPPSSDNSQEEMVPCAKCNTYVQIKEALKRDGKYYCCKECLEG